MNARRTTFSIVGLLAITVSCGAPKPQPMPLKTIKQPPKKGVAKTTDPWAGRSDLYSAPATRAPKALAIPAFSRKKLKNGLSVLALADRSLPLVSVQLLLRAGSIDDPADKVGLADFTAAMLRQGTTRQSADKISATIDAAGASLGASSGYEFSHVACGGRTSALELCLKMVAELVQKPAFLKKEMKEVRDQLRASVKSSLDNPASLAAEHFNNMLYGDKHPAGRPMTMGSIDRISRDDLKRFHRDRFTPPSAMLAISGDIDTKNVERLIKRFFGRWRGKAAPPRKIATVDSPTTTRVLLIDKPTLTQTFFSLGHAGIKLSNPQREAIKVMNYVLGGGGFSSRLMKTVRSKGGKTYGIRSSFSASTHDGSFRVYSFTRTAETVSTLKLAISELERIRKEPPTAAELTAAKGKIAGSHAISYDTGTKLASALAITQLRGLPDTHVTDFAVRVDALTQDAVAKAATDRVYPNRLLIALVGKASEVGPLLRKAKIPFSQISYLDSISAKERKARASGQHAPVSAAQVNAARKILRRAVRTMGGKKALTKVKALRLTGKVKMGQMTGNYQSIFAPPSRVRVAFELGTMKMLVAASGSTGFAQVRVKGHQTAAPKKFLPTAKVKELQGEIWRHPPFVLLNALDAKPRIVKGKSKLTMIAVQPPGQSEVTLLFDGRFRLVEQRYRVSTGEKKTIQFKRFKRTGRISLPHQVIVASSSKPQSLIYEKVEVNPKLGPELFK